MAALRIFATTRAGSTGRSLESAARRSSSASSRCSRTRRRATGRAFGRGAAEHGGAALRAVLLRAACAGVVVETGVFGARMELELVNDGPVTIVLARAG